jgi:ABC-type multidrug transport system fused ATPase/permease subunit
LDLAGVAVLGLLGVLSMSGLESNPPGNRVLWVLKVLNIEAFPFEKQVLVLSGLTCILLVGKTALSIFFTRKILFFLSRCGADISSNLVKRLLSQPLNIIQQRSSQDTLFSVTSGVSLIMLQILATSSVLISDAALMVIMACGLLFLDTFTAIVMFALFALVAYFLNRFVNVRARNLGRATSKLEISSNEKIIEVLSSFRETVVRNRRSYYSKEVGKLRHLMAKSLAEMNFLPYVNKYVIETIVVLGALLIAGIQFALRDAASSFATLTVFLAAGTRIAPAFLRVQQGLISIRSATGQTSPTFELLDSLKEAVIDEDVSDRIETTHLNFNATIKLDNVSYRYPEAHDFAVKGISLIINQGQSVAIVGSSGAGKSTLVDLILGILSPDEGSILISDSNPTQAVSKWPGAVAYVPQDVAVANTTIRKNISLGYPEDSVSQSQVMEVLSMSQLDSFVKDLPDGMNTFVGEKGSWISGGQRQRLGIARALITKPKLLVLDEATSSLDGETEAAIGNALQVLKGTVTVLMISHRLSMLRNVDVLVYMENGEIKCVGSFDEVRNKIENFDNQANLMGL